MQAKDVPQEQPESQGSAEHQIQVAPIDLETRLTDHHHLSLRLWLRMLSSTVKIENEIRSRLRVDFEITLPRFDLMAQLERHPEGLRMGELSKRMMVTGGNVTGIAVQLEKEKLIERTVDVNDRRSFSLKLTPDGIVAFKKMALVHEGWIEDLLQGLNSDEKQQLIQLLSKVKAGSA
jgi:DNA-binding MarR family transcriptional regulator